jgi:hypothetical protein
MVAGGSVVVGPLVHAITAALRLRGTLVHYLSGSRVRLASDVANGTIVGALPTKSSLSISPRDGGNRH